MSRVMADTPTSPPALPSPLTLMRANAFDISLLFLPPYSPELNPKENLWDEIREKIFRNYAFKSIEARAGDPLRRTQSKNRKIHHLIPLHPKVTLMWKWYHTNRPRT